MAQVNSGASLSKKRVLEHMCWTDVGMFQFFSILCKFWVTTKFA